jgi:hypothetical protein
VQALDAAGLAGFYAVPEPLEDAAIKAIHAWNFCGGWFPERLALYEALYGIDDLAQLLELMTVISDHVNSPREES